MDPLTIAVNKNGETPILISLDRSHVGLTIEVKTVRAVEEFMRSLGSGQQLPVEVMGRYWQSLDAKKLLAYDLTANVPYPGGYEFGHLGLPLLGDSGVVNLSFLRLVGVSEGAGVKFGVKGVTSREQLYLFRDVLGKAAKQFYVDFMKPMHLTVMISTQDLR